MSAVQWFDSITANIWMFYLSYILAVLLFGDYVYNIAMEMLDITIMITTGVMMREFPLKESISVCVRVCACVCVRACVRACVKDM